MLWHVLLSQLFYSLAYFPLSHLYIERKFRNEIYCIKCGKKEIIVYINVSFISTHSILLLYSTVFTPAWRRGWREHR